MILFVRLLEVLFLLLFLMIAISFIKKNGLKEFLFFSLPIIVFFYFVEYFWTYRNVGGYEISLFSFYLFNIPLIVPITWVIIIYISTKFTCATVQKYKIVEKKSFLLALSDASYSILFAILFTEPLASNLTLWYHKTNNPFLFKAPLWYFIGWFLGVFIVSFGYRISTFLKKGKRIVFLVCYIGLVIIGRVIFYKMFEF